MTGVRTSCGVLVTDGAQLLLGHATGSARWDIPKGLAEAGEAHLDAALRELWEETGLRASREALVPLGVHHYLSAKQLALFRWRVDHMPALDVLRCTSFFRAWNGHLMPEFDGFAVLAWDDALARLGRNMVRVLAPLRPNGHGTALPRTDTDSGDPQA